MVGVALANATLEELLWRGVYITFWADDPWLGWWPAVGFGAWHLDAAGSPSILDGAGRLCDGGDRSGPLLGLGRLDDRLAPVGQRLARLHRRFGCTIHFVGWSGSSGELEVLADAGRRPCRDGFDSGGLYLRMIVPRLTSSSSS